MGQSGGRPFVNDDVCSDFQIPWTSAQKIEYFTFTHEDEEKTAAPHHLCKTIIPPRYVRKPTLQGYRPTVSSGDEGYGHKLDTYDRTNFFVIGLSMGSSEARLFSANDSGFGVTAPFIGAPGAQIPSGSVIGSNYDTIIHYYHSTRQ